MLKNIDIHKLNFRKDINFLRGIAVLAVLFYHINRDTVTGGWLGVDLFFFISGYLITNKLILGLRSKKEFIREFFKNRFLRLTPALISTSTLASLFSFNFLSPLELKLHLESTFYSLIYISNIFFTNLDFYKSPNNKYLTMLHTWSLGIEEQFYIILPIFLIFSYKKSKKIFYTIFLLFIFSLFLNLTFESENIFYNPLTRFWEFLAGSLYMMYENYFKEKLNINTSFIGLLIIFATFFLFSDNLINAIYPKITLIIGAIFFMLGENNYYLVKNKFIQIIGNISYSLYLFHQPFIAFMYIQNDKISRLTTTTEFLILLAMFLFSYMNWLFVEKRFNKTKFFKISIIIYFFIVFIFGLIIFDIPDEMSILNLPNKLFLLKIKDADILSVDGKSCDNRPVSETCEIIRNERQKTIYVLGDSTLRTLSAAILEKKEMENYNLVHFTGNNCIFIFDKNPVPGEKTCPEKTIKEKNDFGENIKDSIIIYGARYPRYFSGTGFDNGTVKEINSIKVIKNLKDEIRKTISIFAKNNNTIILIYPIPEQGWNVPELFYYKNLKTDATVAYPTSIWTKREAESVIFLDSLNAESLIRIYPRKIFCDSFVNDSCVGAFDGKIFYADDDHLSLEGSRLLADVIFNSISNK